MTILTRPRRRSGSSATSSISNSHRSLLLCGILGSLSLPSTSTAQDLDCQAADAPSLYSGFSLKRGGACETYVNCENGIMTSTLSCPPGLLFNGGVGITGVCDWPANVVCQDPGVDLSPSGEGMKNVTLDVPGMDALGAAEAAGGLTTNTTVMATTAATAAATVDLSSNQEGPAVINLDIPGVTLPEAQAGLEGGSSATTAAATTTPAATTAAATAGAGSTTAAATTAAATTAAVTTADATTAAADTTAASNPKNFFCGYDFSNAESLCLPCPGGTMFECQDPTHGCFENVSSCASAGSGASPSAPTPAETNPGAAPSANFGASPGTSPDSSPAASPGTPSVPTPSALSGTPAPSASPSLPPWTNAPFSALPLSQQDGDKVVIGYYAGWQWYDRNKFADPVNVDFSKYDRINYAFFQPDLKGNIYGTDEWADPQLLWGPYEYNAANQDENTNYFCSWDFPDKKNCNYHQTDKGIIHLAKQAGAQVMPSIGGWTLSDNFPTIAASQSTRDYFAQQCVELLKAYDFDGIDIDWEYPAYEDHSGTPEDTVNFTLLLQAIRDALDAHGAQTGKYYPLSAALPCGPDKIENIEVHNIKDILDELNLMSYDLHGAWDELTGMNAPLYDQGWTDLTKRWSIHGCVENYREKGVPLSKMNLGLPWYGRSFRKATGTKQLHGGPDDINFHLDEGSPQYFNIVNELHRMDTYRHEKTATQYAVFLDSDGGFTSYDDPRAICDKVEYALERGMHGFLVWEISGDMLDNGETPLIDATNSKLQDPSLDCSTLRDPLWALSRPDYLIAPPEPDVVDRSGAPPPSPSEPSPAEPSFRSPANPAPSPSSPSSEGSMPEPSNDCPSDFTGYWATADCTQYMYCNAGMVEGTPLPCVPGTLFDITIGVCTWGANVVGCSR
ncbi:hypothetical protein ACHAXS_012995 [Conticribra weissflogii]